MPFSPFSRHLILLRSKYPPQHPVLKHPQSMLGWIILVLWINWERKTENKGRCSREPQSMLGWIILVLWINWERKTENKGRCSRELAIEFEESLQYKKKTPWSESAGELYRPSDRRLSAKWLPTVSDRGCHVVSVTDSYGRILGFIDRSRYFSIK
jgi:hypothetical protein